MWISCQLLLGFCITHINLLNHKHCSDSCGHHLGQDNEDCCQISGFKGVLDIDLQSRIKQHEVSWVFCINRRMAGFRNHWFFSGSEENWSILASLFSLGPCFFPLSCLFLCFFLQVALWHPHSTQPCSSTSSQFFSTLPGSDFPCVVMSIQVLYFITSLCQHLTEISLLKPCEKSLPSQTKSWCSAVPN